MKICKAFVNGWSANTKFEKTQLSQVRQLEGFLFGPSILPEIISLANPIINSFKKELKNTGTKRIKLVKQYNW